MKRQNRIAFFNILSVVLLNGKMQWKQFAKLLLNPAILGVLLGLLAPRQSRPSEDENRMLAGFPELTQETLLSALQSSAEPEDPEAWLATVLRRRHADMLRRKYRRPTVCIDCVPEPPAPVHDDAEREAEEAIVRREVAFMDTDREIWPDIQKVEELVRSSELLDLVCNLVPDFE